MQIRHLEENIDLKKTFFIVSSKSGSTLEPNIFKEYFYTRLQTVLNKTEVGDRFIAITDPGTALETIAKNDHFKAIFHGVPSIGGRYSASVQFRHGTIRINGCGCERIFTVMLKQCNRLARPLS